MSTDQPSRFSVNGATMGTRWSAVFFASRVNQAIIAADLQAAVDTVDATMSTWQPQSALMQFNRANLGQWVVMPASLCAVIALSLQIGTASGGAFDIGVGAAVEAWGFGATRTAPDAVSIRQISAVTAAGAIEVDLANARLRRNSEVQLDLSGIAKGFGVDRLAETLLAHGIADFIVSIDGEMRLSGSKPDGSGWLVGLERPDRTQRALARTLEVSDLAIATSGDYRHWRDHNGTLVSHTIDPRTGAPLQSELCAVTVTAEHCAVADAWATALLVMGAEDGLAMAARLGLDALFTLRRGDGFTEIGAGAFAAASVMQQQGVHIK
ncbi:MAG: FAD:protein FMN transferase [Devosia sp.]